MVLIIHLFFPLTKNALISSGTGQGNLKHEVIRGFFNADDMRAFITAFNPVLPADAGSAMAESITG